MAVPPEVFLDSDGVIVGMWSETGAMRQVLRLGEAGVVRLAISSRVLEDLEELIRDRAPEALADTAVLLDRAGVEVLEDPPEDVVDELRSVLTFESDARVLGSALHAGMEWFLTYDWTDYLNNDELQDTVDVRVAPPGDLLREFTDALLKT